MDLKKPLSFSDQVQQLNSHGLLIDDPAKAQEFLQRVNYYKFTGYALQFRVSPTGSDLVPGHHFSEIQRIYEFDEGLRNLLRKYLEIVEIYYKTQIANTFALEKCTVPPYDQHYDPQNYYKKDKFAIAMANLQKSSVYFSDSLIYKHHANVYQGKMPLWVIVELLSFSSVSMLYSAMYRTSQTRIASKFGIGADTLENHLHCMSVLRNKCSHTARLINVRYNPPAKLSTAFMRNNPSVSNDSLFAYLLVLKWRLPENSMRKDFKNELVSLLRQYNDVVDLSLIGFPQNYINIL